MGGSYSEWVRRILAITLSAVLVVSGFPAQAFSEVVGEAADSTTTDAGALGEDSAGKAKEAPESAGEPKSSEGMLSEEGAPPSEGADQASSREVDEYLRIAAAALAAQVREEPEEGTPGADYVRSAYTRLVRILGGMEQGELALELKSRLRTCTDSARLFTLEMDELGVKCIEVVATDESATWNMVKVDDAWYHVDAWRAGAKYAELLKEAEDASAVEVPLDWLLVGDKRLAVPEDSPLTWKRLDGEKAPESVGDYADRSAEETDSADSAQDNLTHARQVEQDLQDGKNSEDAVLAAQGTTIVDSGTCGTCPWSLDSEGTLTIGPGTLASNDNDNVFEAWPWLANKANDGMRLNKTVNINRVKFSGTVTAHDNLDGMFRNCTVLESVDTTGLDVSRAKSMAYMFRGCESLAELDVSSWDTSKVENMSFMFYECYELSTLDLSSWKTSCVTDMNSMFYNCPISNTSIDLSGWDTSHVTNMQSMFNSSGPRFTAVSIDLSGWNTSLITSMRGMFWGTNITHVDLSDWNTSSVTDMSWMFLYASELESVDLSGWDTSRVTNMDSMFSECTSLTSIDHSGWDTSNVKCMQYIFKWCSFSSLDLSDWDTSSVTDMSCMFYGCNDLTYLNLSGWDTSSVTNMDSMFENCETLKTISVDEAWNTRSVTDCGDLFWGCESLVGGNGTPYNGDDDFLEYARIDAPGSPGYLTRGYGSHEANPNYALASVKMHKTNDREYDLLTTSRSIDVLNRDTICQFKAELKDPAVVAKKYTLYQKVGEGYNVIAEAGPDGNFGYVTYGEFIASNPVRVSVTGQNGMVAQTKELLLEVKDSSKEDLPSSFSVGDGIEIVLNGWPFDGQKVELPIMELPVTYEASSDGKIKVGVNLDVKARDDDEPFWFDQFMTKKGFEKLWKEAKKKNRVIKNSEKNVGGKPKFSFNVIGYLEGSLATNEYEGSIGIEVSFGGKQENQHMVWIIPVVTEVSADITASGSVTSKMRIKNQNLLFNDVELRVGAEGSVGIYGGVGAAYVWSFGVWGNAGVGLNYAFLPERQRGLEEIYVQGTAGVKMIVFSKSFSLTLVDTDKQYLYKRDVSMGGQSIESDSNNPADLLMSIQSDDTGASMDRSYKDKTTVWKGSTGLEGNDQLQGNVYPDARIQTVPVDGGLLMTFLTDDAARGDDNRSMLVWSRYDEESGVWSDPQPVWQDGTADLSHHLCSDGAGGAWMVWSNARQPVTDGLTLSDEAALLDVAAAHFDAGRNAVEGAAFVTDDSSVLEASPHVGVVGGAPVIAWTENSLSDVLGTTGEHGVCVAQRGGSSWTTQRVGTASGLVTSIEAGELVGAASVAWATDGDGNQETVEDSSVWAWRDGVDATTLGESSAWNPRFALADGASVLTWSQGGALKYTSDRTTVEDAELNDLPVAAYELSGDLAGDALLTYAYYENGSGNVRGRTCATGSWSPEVAYTTQGQSVTSWGANLVGGVPVLAYAISTETEAESKDAGIWFTSGSTMAAVSVSDAWYEDGKIHAVVNNVGLTAVSSVTLQGGDSNGGQYETHHEDPIAPGESVELEMEVNEPALGKATTYSVLAKPSPDATQPTEVTVGEASLRASTEHRVVDGKESFVATVSNAGLAPSPAGKVVFYNYETGESIHEGALATLPGGESRSVTYACDGMLSDSGIRAVGVRVEDNGGNVLASDLSDAWEGELDEQFDWDAPGADKTRIARATVSPIQDQAYTGEAVTPRPAVTLDGRELAESVDYRLSYRDNVDPGTATVTITGKGNYVGSKSVTFRVVAKNRWVRQGGSWYYYGADGGRAKGWRQVGGKWYYLDPSSGAMRTGWLRSGGAWYYLAPSGAMATGWVKVGSAWYYFAASGAMVTGWLRLGSTWHYLKGSGAMAVGWQKVGSNWYYFAGSGAMATGWLKEAGKWYYFNGSGAMVTGWQKVGSAWYYFASSGAMATGWLKLGSTWYYFNASGAMVTGRQSIGGKWYTFNSSGAWVA